VFVAFLLAQLEFPGLLSDSLWHLPVYTARPTAGPGFLLYRYPLELEGITLRFANDPSVFHSTPFVISGRSLFLRQTDLSKPITTAYSEQAGAWGFSRFGALFARGLGHGGRLLGTFDYNEFGVLDEQMVSHQGLIASSGSVRGINLDALVISASRDSLSWLHARAGVGFGPLSIRGWRSSCGPLSSGGLSLAARAGDLSLVLSREEIAWDGRFTGIWAPRLSWSSGGLGAWAGWLAADSGRGPIVGARAAGSLGSIEMGYRTDIPDPGFMPGLSRTISEAYVSGEVRGCGLAARADAGWGDWLYGYAGDSGGIRGLAHGARASGGLYGNWRFGPLLFGAGGQASWFSEPAPEQFYWQGAGLSGLMISFLGGDILAVPSLSGRYYGEPFSGLWSAARLDLTFYKSVRAYASLDNALGNTIGFFGYRWRGRVWRFGASLVLWD